MFVGNDNNNYGLNGNNNLNNNGRFVGIAKLTKAGTEIIFILKWTAKLIFLIKLLLTIIFT